MTAHLFHGLGVVVVLAPVLLLAVLGLSSLISRPLSELAMARWTEFLVIVGLVASAAVLVLMLITGVRHVDVEIGDWVHLPGDNFRFNLKFVFDRLSVPFVLLTFVLVGTIGAFANRYLHRDVGYGRFFLLYAVFLFGMIIATLAGTIESLFLGWELVGLSSALLVAYFHERRAPVVNGYRVWSVYRFADAAFLIAAVAMHHLTRAGEFSVLAGEGVWPDGVAHQLTSGQALFVGLLLLVAAAGKSGLIPFSGWLPRAMEGPTPSSAVFYGALSVHLGAYLLLRVSPLLELSTTLSITVVVLGLASAVFGALAGRVQNDAKTVLAFASLTQVGLITAEIGLGLRYVALIHIIGHACLRTLQLLRAPSLLRDYHQMENALGGHLPHKQDVLSHRVPGRVNRLIFAWAFQRGGFDSAIDRFVVRPFTAIFRQCNRLERMWTEFLTGKTALPPSRSSVRPLTPDEICAEEIV